MTVVVVPDFSGSARVRLGSSYCGSLAGLAVGRPTSTGADSRVKKRLPFQSCFLENAKNFFLIFFKNV